MKAIDVNGVEIKSGDIVRIIHVPEHTNHGWLRVGNTLKVRYTEDRRPFVSSVLCFLESKKGGKLCHSGMACNHLELVK